MNLLTLLDRLGDFTSQIVAQCQFWCLLGGFAVALVVFVAVGIAMLQLIEALDRNDVGSAIRR